MRSHSTSIRNPPPPPRPDVSAVVRLALPSMDPDAMEPSAEVTPVGSARFTTLGTSAAAPIGTAVGVATLFKCFSRRTASQNGHAWHSVDDGGKSSTRIGTLAGWSGWNVGGNTYGEAYAATRSMPYGPL